MKIKTMSLATVLGLGALTAAMSSSGAALTVGSEDFESYSLGTWDTNSAPAVNPIWGGGTLSADIVDSGTTNGNELLVGLDLSNQYSSGITFDLDLSGNASKDRADYTLEGYVWFDPATVGSVSNFGFEVSAFNANDILQGTTFPLSQVDTNGFAAALTNGLRYKFSIPMAQTYRHWSKSKSIDTTASSWRMTFAVGNQYQTNNSVPCSFAIDQLALKYTEPKFVNPSGLPTGIALTNALDVTGTVIDGTSEVTTMVLYLDGSVVASNSTYAGGSTTNTISFAASGLAADGASHSAMVVAMDASTNSVSYSWNFKVYTSKPAPETTPVAMYNMNFQGSDNQYAGGQYPVADGTVASAPSLGTNGWYNINYGNPWYFSYQAMTVPESSGATTNTITYSWVDGSSGGMYTPWTWGNSFGTFATDAAGTMWPIAMGGDNCNINIELQNLDADSSYDLYLYFTRPDGVDPATTTYTITTGIAPYPTETLVADRDMLFNELLEFQNTYVLGSNYVVITDITPVENKIGFNAAGIGGAGGISAMQLVVRKPTVVIAPDIQSFSMASGTANLLWTSKAGVSYSVMHKSSLTDPTWTTVTNVAGSADSTSVTVPASSSKEYFMIQSN